VSAQAGRHAFRSGYTPAMRFYSWNVNGIRSVIRKGTFQKFIEEHKPDILCLQETKAERGQAEIDLPEYIEYWNSAEKKGYSGTAIFTRIEPVNVTLGFPEDFASRFSFADELKRDAWNEGRVITAEFDRYYAVTVYTPNAKDDLSRLNLRYRHWDPAFLEYVKMLDRSKPVIFCGDLNVAHTELDLANPKTNRGKKGFTDEEREGFQRFIDAGFVDTFRIFTQGNGHYTWWSHFANSRARNIGWRIDYVLVSRSIADRVRAARIHAEVMGSDHCPVSIEIDI
jgi:exodeoxyribonuclease-3